VEVFMSGRSRAFLVASLTALALVATSVPALAQSGGIKGGFLYSSLSFDETSDVWEGNNGWTFGLFYGSKKERSVGFMGELNFQQRGGGTAVGDVKLYYLDIPFLLRVGAGEAVNVYGIAGAAFDIKIGESSSGVGDVQLVQEWDGIDMGIVLGGGFEFGLFIVEGRITWGLRNIATQVLAPFEGEKLTNRSFALQAGLRFK
jgi:hypothetical protein